MVARAICHLGMSLSVPGTRRELDRRPCLTAESSGSALQISAAVGLLPPPRGPQGMCPTMSWLFMCLSPPPDPSGDHVQFP